MNTRIVLFAAVLALGILAVDGSVTEESLLTENAAAYCDPVLSEVMGGCTNSCIEATKIYHKITGEDPPWVCPM